MARAPALHAGGQEFESLILHNFLFFLYFLVIDHLGFWFFRNEKLKVRNLDYPLSRLNSIKFFDMLEKERKQTRKENYSTTIMR